MTSLFDPLQVGDLRLPNRMVMAPMARRRAEEGSVPSSFAPTYYSQRASAGLVITEGTAPSPGGRGSLRMPGIYSEPQIAAWRRVTDAVHDHGGRIFVQLMHSGRMAHSSRMDGLQPVAPSGIKPAGQIIHASGEMVEYEMPHALELSEIPVVIEEYAHATRCALAAGFDGVELHGASGFLPMQFLCSSTNQRTDAYGGSALNRSRFTLEALDAMAGVAGKGRVGVKLSPEYLNNDIRDANPVETYSTVVGEISRIGIAYLHVSTHAKVSVDYHAVLRPLFHGPYLAGGGLTAQTASTMIAEGRVDAAVFGVLFLANPDLPERFGAGAPLNAPDRDTFYTTGPKGYVDYPVLEPALPAGTNGSADQS